MTLSIKNLCFQYGKQTILNDVSTTLKQGELVCLLGPNGSGKTTMLNCISGFEDDFDGYIEIEGIPVSKMRDTERARRIAYMPQKDEVNFPFAAREVVLMGRTPYLGRFDVPGDKDHALVLAVLEALDIQHLADQMYHTLSGGEKQLVRIARGLVQGAVFQLLDEPTASLDLKNEMMVLEHISDMMLSSSHGIVMSTHDPNHAFYFAQRGVKTRAVLLEAGAVVSEGAPEAVLTVDNIRRVYRLGTQILSFTADGAVKPQSHIVPIRTERGI
ncbi:ABC transporter ATP-binding protein [Fusibacter paucivorans]|uniref:ABC transporter ATP-binding protein n=1 Tax=Fusibacter paucivorans TaxID=76009 RepID=A0ABS5PML7_9FIRM|nr:ABC transporter ATP-binding protein [Fusibacter paucivorans]MBS7526286.1 ABC transporter ATP-binding protein [Fusibacter paucivorans]